jgi:hypothetical protein
LRVSEAISSVSDNRPKASIINDLPADTAGAPGCPVGPFSCHGEAAEIMVPKAQGFDACNPSDLQDDKSLTAKWMKRMGYLSRSQRLLG